MKLLKPLAILLILTALGCGAQPGVQSSATEPSNATYLEEVNAAKAWFHAKKVRPIWAKVLEKDQTVKTIEGNETVKAGDFICRGEAGDIWPQTAKSFEERYQKTAEVDADGWTKYTPRPENQGVMAAQVQHAFSIRAKWGVLSGKPGDYIVKSFSDRDTALPDNVWIVDQKLFHATYTAVEEDR